MCLSLNQNVYCRPLLNRPRPLQLLLHHQTILSKLIFNIIPAYVFQAVFSAELARLEIF
jgi:hypothetical protein